MTTNEMPDMIWAAIPEHCDMRYWFRDTTAGTVSYTRTGLIEQRAADAAERLVKRGRFDTFVDWTAEVERVYGVIMTALKGETK